MLLIEALREAHALSSPLGCHLPCGDSEFTDRASHRCPVCGLVPYRLPPEKSPTGYTKRPVPISLPQPVESIGSGSGQLWDRWALRSGVLSGHELTRCAASPEPAPADRD